jgi:hypothetical protein
MGFRFPENTIFAYLDKDDVPAICTREEACEWLQSEEGRRRSEIRSDDASGWRVYTHFQHFSSDPDVPMFWEVTWYTLVGPWRTGKRRFGTKEAALEFHATLVSGEQPPDELTEDDEDQDGADWWKA